MDISNKTLGLLLVAAIVVSVGSTFFTIDSLTTAPTGFASQTGTGDVNLSIATTVSILMNDSVIDFGACTVDVARTFDSSLTIADVDNSNCTGGTFPDYMIVENDGNINADVIVRVTDNLPSSPALYADAATATMDFQTINATIRPGCGAVHTWTNFAALATDYAACDNLGSTDTNDRFEFYVRVSLPQGAYSAGDNQMGLLFTASQV